MKNNSKLIRSAIAGILMAMAFVASSTSASAQTEIAKWTFETSVPVGTPGAGVWITNIVAEGGSGTASALHAGNSSYSNPVGNGSAESFSANTWAIGDFFQFAFSTLGQTNISISFDQTGSSTGPGQHKLAYSTDGINFTDFGSVYTIPPNISWSSSVFTNATTFSFDLSSISGLNGQPTVYLRLVAASTTSINGGTVASGGTCRLDNFTAFANNPGPVSIDLDPQNTTANVWSMPSLSVTASGPLPKYQWYKDGVALTDGGNISGANESVLSFTNVVHSNEGIYKVVVSNSFNSVTSAPAQLTVTGFAIVAERANVVAGGTISSGFTIIDAQTSVTSISANSGNQNIVSDANVSVSTTVPNVSGYVTMKASAGVSGVAVVTISATDGSFTTNASFPLMVVPANSVLLNDSFEYADGPLGANSANLWQNHGGTAGDLQVVSGMIYLSRIASEDVNAELIGQPYTADSGKKLYSKFTVNFSASDTPTSTGTYLAHFKDNEFGFRGRVWVSTNAAGAIRLGIGNGSDANKSSGEFPLDIAAATTYTVVTRLDLSNDSSTIWINPTSESDQSVTATDAVTNGFINVTSYAFRQNSGMSKLFVDDLVVGTSFNAVMGNPEPDPIPLSAVRQGNNLILSWEDPSFVLESAPEVTGTYSPVSGATSPYTNSIAGNRQFFRLHK